jgi:hypothetical protein
MSEPSSTRKASGLQKSSMTEFLKVLTPMVIFKYATVGFIVCGYILIIITFILALFGVF